MSHHNYVHIFGQNLSTPGHRFYGYWQPAGEQTNLALRFEVDGTIILQIDSSRESLYSSGHNKQKYLAKKT